MNNPFRWIIIQYLLLWAVRLTPNDPNGRDLVETLTAFFHRENERLAADPRLAEIVRKRARP